MIASSHQAEARRNSSLSGDCGLNCEGMVLARGSLGMRLLRDRAIHAAKQSLTESGQTTVHRAGGAAKLFGYFCRFHAGKIASVQEPAVAGRKLLHAAA